MWKADDLQNLSSAVIKYYMHYGEVWTDTVGLSLAHSILVFMSISHPWPRAKEEISYPSSSG